MPHVHAKDTIGNTLAIDLRLSADSEFISVTLTNDVAATDVAIDATGLAVGTYTLKLESFDTNGTVFSTLKNDIITISVLEPEAEPEAEAEAEAEAEPEAEIEEDTLTGLASFLGPVEIVSIVSGTKHEWSLPEIDAGVIEIYAVDFDADYSISAYLTYNIETNKIEYNGVKIAGLTRKKFVNSKITLINTAG